MNVCHTIGKRSFLKLRSRKGDLVEFVRFDLQINSQFLSECCLPATRPANNMNPREILSLLESTSGSMPFVFVVDVGDQFAAGKASLHFRSFFQRSFLRNHSQVPYECNTRF